MKFYKRFPGDIQIKTGHLTPAEFGCYDRLLDHYYATESAIPDGRAYSICRAVTKADRGAVDRVLAEFFMSTGDGWVQQRAEEMIAEAQPRIEAAKQNGKKGGRPKSKPTGFFDETHGSESGKASQSQIPDTREATEDYVPRRIAGADATPLPDGSPTPGEVCGALRRAGLARVNSEHPVLRELLGAGATVAEFLGHADRAMGKEDPFAYLLATVAGERKRAAAVGGEIHRGPLKAANKQQAIEDENRRVAARWAAEAT